jgi:hypothetical protein
MNKNAMPIPITEVSKNIYIVLSIILITLFAGLKPLKKL